MAIEYHLDVYPSDDPRDGTRLVRLSADNALQSVDVRDVIGVGSGQFSLRATTTEAAFITPEGEQYVRVVRDDGSTELVVDGFWTNQIRYEAAVRNETKRLTVGGAGRMAYLARAVMAPHSYLNAALPGFIPQDPYDQRWRLWNQGLAAGGDFLGAMLWRVVTEAQNYRSGATYTHKHVDGETYTDSHDDDRRRNAIPDLVLGFDQFEDSDGNAWTMTSGEFSAMTGENLLAVVRRLMEAGLYVDMDPDTFELRAWEGTDHRRDRTGGAWGTNVVRLQAPTDGTIATGNIKSDSERLISSHIRRTTIWSGGAGDVYGFADTASGVPWEGFAPSDAADVDALDNLADTQMAARSEAGDVLSARLKLGQAPASGTYLPWEHVKLDDLVTVHTGTDEWDYNEAEYPVAALRIHLREGGDWDAWVDLGASFEAMVERRFEVSAAAAHTHPPNPQLCRPATGTTFTGLGSLGSNATLDPTDYNEHSGFPGGPKVERVTLTLVDGVPAGRSVVVIVAQRGSASELREIWDSAGNTYSEVADHSAGAGGQAGRIFFSVLANALSAGDTISYDVSVGAGGAGLDRGGKCISAYAFAGTVLSGVESGNASGLSTTPSVAVGAGDLIVAMFASGGGATGFPDVVTDDADWISFDQAFTAADSSDAIGLYGGWRIAEANGETWAGTIDQARNWTGLGAVFTVQTGAAVNDGHPELVGTSTRAARCDHRHDVHRDTAPTAADDFATAGYKLGTIWARLDDLVTPTAIETVYVLVDDTTAAAVWLPLPAGVSDHGMLAGLADDDHPQYTTAAELATAIAAYVDTAEPSRRWEAVTDGENVLVWESDDLVHEWKDY